MHKNPDFPDLLRLIDDRSAAFRAAIAAAPDLDAKVPSCPEWTLHDLARHLGSGDRFWAAIVAAGPADGPPAEAVAARAAIVAPREREALTAWLADSTQQLLDTLRAVGAEADCWTWWPGSQTPQSAGGVARHRVQESAVHTYDAQLANGAAEMLPEEVALDGVEEFQFTCVATPVAWPHTPAVIDYHATEGRSWRLHLGADGVQVERLTDHPTGAAATPADVSARGIASELVLFCYGRFSLDAMNIDGDRQVFQQLIDWDPSA
ncbi:maleylpyruvate isomerase family mycothiol-dependent enzyme [Kitasatospora sp. NPDC059146]|uniref:maleylpyruvate isomerase family mycothiol-dependent enzyme n=1 Tax=unclassified Kitasatospora TaxID=2633591 RepID=UPI0036BA79AA